MDLGSTENCAEDGIMAHQSRSIPWELLPRGLKEAVQQAQGTTDKRPDGMLYKPKNGNNPAEYWIIEVKICRDSDPTGQQSKADYQHRVLIDKIKDIDPTAKVWYYPLLVGVTGTIYNSTIMNLQALGIKGQALKQCISEVHRRKFWGVLVNTVEKATCCRQCVDRLHQRCVDKTLLIQPVNRFIRYPLLCIGVDGIGR